MELQTLETSLLAAHAREDWPALVHLYTHAADDAEQREDIDAACFYLTHAFVFALESGAPEAATLNRRLAAEGRATLLEF